MLHIYPGVSDFVPDPGVSEFASNSGPSDFFLDVKATDFIPDLGATDFIPDPGLSSNVPGLRVLNFTQTPEVPGLVSDEVLNLAKVQGTSEFIFDPGKSVFSGAANLKYGKLIAMSLISSNILTFFRIFDEIGSMLAILYYVVF